MTLALETRGLRKEYPNTVALKSLDLQVRQGEVFGFLGANGAGKTTFTKCVTGFVRPTAGEVRILGIDAIADPVAAAPYIGLVPDQYDFYSNLTGRQHLDFYGRLQGIPAEERSARIEEMLDLVRMQERADTRVKGYSHGMKQRICIAQALLHRPRVIFFDEPTNGLDPKGAYELREMIRGLARDGTTVFLSSHILPEVEQVCDRVAIVVKGEVAAAGTMRELRAKTSGGAGVGTTKVRLMNPDRKHITVVAKVTSAVRLDGEILEFKADEAGVAEAVALLVKAGAKVIGVHHEAASLESIFLGITDQDPAAQTQPGGWVAA